MSTNSLFSVSFKNTEEMQAVERALKLQFLDVRQRGTHVAMYTRGKAARKLVQETRDRIRATKA